MAEWLRALIFEPLHGKTNNLHMRKTKAQISFVVTAKLISAFVFATRIAQSLYFLNTKFRASSCFLILNSPVCVGPVRKPHCWFSLEAAHFITALFTAHLTAVSGVSSSPRQGTCDTNQVPLAGVPGVFCLRFFHFCPTYPLARLI